MKNATQERRAAKQNERCFGIYRLIEEIFDNLGEGLRLEEIVKATEGFSERQVLAALKWAEGRKEVVDQGAAGWSRVEAVEQAALATRVEKYRAYLKEQREQFAHA